MIGFWNYTVILTYIGLATSVVGMTHAVNGNFKHAIICLAISGLCDAFDGTIARTRTVSTDSEKMFGTQLDSLCDVVCFGFFPATICYCMGIRSKVGVALIIFYVICAVARLGYFNVLEIERDPEDDSPKVFYGLPVTSISVVFPVVYFLSYWFTMDLKPMLLELMLLILGGLFIANIKLKKPKLVHILLLAICVAALFIIMPYLTMTK